MVTIDTAEYLLDKFADNNWRFIVEQLENGELTFEESLKREFEMLKIPEKTMLDALEPATRFRPNFDKLIQYCDEHRFPLVVVSGGLDFSIRHFLEQKGWLNKVEIYGPKSNCTGNGITLSFPRRFEPTSTNFKDDLVTHYKKQGERVIYIGNGLGDYPATRAADLAFAIKGSRLAELCKSAGVTFGEITDFQEVVESLRDSIS